MAFRQTRFTEHTGTPSVETTTTLPTPTLAGSNKKQAAQFDDLATGSATQSEEMWIGLNYFDPRTHTKLANARVTKMHGTYQTGHTLNAGYTATYATPKAAGVPSTVATSAIPATLDKWHAAVTGALTLDTFDATDSEYQFLVMQHDITTAPIAWDPSKQIGDSGYAIVEVAYQIVDKDSNNTVAPGGNDTSSMYSQTPIDFYIVVNGEMQLFGCTQNATTAGFGLEWDTVVKGALNGTVSKFLTSRTNEFSGTLLSLNPFNWVNFLYGKNIGSNGVSTTIQVNSDWQPVQTVEVYIDTFSQEGRRLTFHAPSAFLKINGDIPLGDGIAAMPFMIDMGENLNAYISDDLWDVNRFLVDITLT